MCVSFESHHHHHHITISHAETGLHDKYLFVGFNGFESFSSWNMSPVIYFRFQKDRNYALKECSFRVRDHLWALCVCVCISNLHDTMLSPKQTALYVIAICTDCTCSIKTEINVSSDFGSDLWLTHTRAHTHARLHDTSIKKRILVQRLGIFNSGINTQKRTIKIRIRREHWKDFISTADSQISLYELNKAIASLGTDPHFSERWSR